MLKRSLSLLAAVSIALSAAASWVEDARCAVAACVSRAWAGVSDFMATIFVGPVDLRQAAEVKPQKQVTASQHFVLRLLKRDRPVITADWRMCPSI